MCWAHPEKSRWSFTKLKSSDKAPLSDGKSCGKGRLTEKMITNYKIILE